MLDFGRSRTRRTLGPENSVYNRNYSPYQKRAANRSVNEAAITTTSRRSRRAWLSCRSCRPHAPFAQLVRLSTASIVDELREENRRRGLGE